MLLNLRPNSIASPLVRVLSAVGSIALLGFQGFVLAMSSRGLDLTDEGFYLNSILWADHYKFGVSGFGNFYAIFFDLLGEDWVALRAFTVVTNWVLWVTLGLLALRLVASRTGNRIDWTTTLFFSLASGAFSLLVLNLWLSTPSYNTLAFQAVTIFVCGLLAGRIWGRVGIPVIGLGLFLSFVAKPTTTIALVAILALVNLRKSRAAIVDFIAVGVVSLGLLVAWAIYLDGSILEHINRLAVGLTFTSLLDGGQIVWGENWASRLAGAFWPFVGLRAPQVTYIAVATLSLLWLFLNRLFMPSRNPGGQRFFYLLGSSVFGISLLLLFISREAGYFGQITLVGLLAILFFVLIGIAYNRRDSKFIDQPLVSSADLRLVLGIGLTPLAFAFGTNNNFWQQSSAVGGMYFLSAVLVISSVSTKHFIGRNSPSGIQLILTMAGVAVTATTVLGAMNVPYRQSSTVFEMVSSSEVSGIYVDKDANRFFKDLSDLRETSDFLSGTPLIDNTGASPTAIYVLGGLPLGSAWLIGGYPGSQELAEAQLRLYSQPCLDLAWILDEPTAPRRVFGFDPEEFSLSPSNTYEAVGAVKNPLTGGTQILYRPSNKSLTDSVVCSLNR